MTQRSTTNWGDSDLAVDMVPRMRLKAGATLWPDSVAADGPIPPGPCFARIL
ncbi:MAG: hypothetical protein U1U88_001965 [Lawsonella clevelandensis]